MAAIWEWHEDERDLSDYKANSGPVEMSYVIESPKSLQRVIARVDAGAMWSVDSPDYNHPGGPGGCSVQVQLSLQDDTGTQYLWRAKPGMVVGGGLFYSTNLIGWAEGALSPGLEIDMQVRKAAPPQPASGLILTLSVLPLVMTPIQTQWPPWDRFDGISWWRVLTSEPGLSSTT